MEDKALGNQVAVEMEKYGEDKYLRLGDVLPHSGCTGELIEMIMTPKAQATETKIN